MSTTLIFAELLIIGLEVAIWLFILGIDIFGYQWLQGGQIPILNNWQTIFVTLFFSLIYVLGVIFDRIADTAFSRWNHQIRNKIIPQVKNQIIPSNIPAHVAVIRFEVGKENEALNHQFEYTRSRIRITRASSLNFVVITFLIAIFIVVYLQSNPVWWKYLCFSLGIGITLTVASIFTWYRLTVAYLRFLKSSYDFETSKQVANKPPLVETSKQ